MDEMTLGVGGSGQARPNPTADGQRDSGSRWKSKWTLISGGVLVASVLILAIALGRGASGENEHAIEDSSRAHERSTDGDRIVNGSEAAVGGGRDTKITFGDVTILIPASSVSGKGVVHVRSAEDQSPPSGLELAVRPVEVEIVGTEQVAPVSMSFTVPADVGAQSTQITKPSGRGCCVLENGDWDPENGVLTSTVPDIGWEAVAISRRAVAASEAAALINDRFSADVGPVDAPSCKPPASGGRWEVTASPDSAIGWCIEGRGSDGMQLRIKNNRPAAVTISVPSVLGVEQEALTDALTVLQEKASGAVAPLGRKLVLVPGGQEIVVDLSTVAVGQKQSISLSRTGLSWGSDISDIAAQLVARLVGQFPTWIGVENNSTLTQASALSRLFASSTCLSESTTAAALTSSDPSTMAASTEGLMNCLMALTKTEQVSALLVDTVDSAFGALRSEFARAITEGVVRGESGDRVIEVGHHGQPVTTAPIPALTARPSASEAAVASPPAKSPSPPVAAVTTTTVAATTTTQPPTCVTAKIGSWSGRWISDGGITGTLSAVLKTVSPNVTGTVEVRGSTFIPGGPIVGTSRCASIRIGRVDNQIEFIGTVEPGGTRISGTYIAYSGGLPADEGTFSANFVG